MADPIWFSGSSGDVADSRMDAWRRERTGVLEGDASRAQRANELNMQAFLGERARADAMQERDLNRNAIASEAASRTMLNRNQAAQSRADALMLNQQEQPLRDANVAMVKAQTAQINAKTGLDPTTERYNLQLAQSAAVNGGFLAPDHAEKQYGLPSDTSKILYNISKSAQAEIDKQDEELKAAADTMTAWSKNSTALAALKKPEGGFFSGPDKKLQSDYETNLQRLTQMQEQLRKRVEFLQSAKKQDILNQLNPDPQTGAWIYKSPWRPWRLPPEGQTFWQVD